MNIIIVFKDKNKSLLFANQLIDLLPFTQVFRFNDPMMAIKYIAHNPIDMIFAEAEMKFIDVLQFTKLVRKFKPDTDISILSDNEKHEALSVIAGADRFIQEPVSEAVLEAIINSSSMISGG